MRTALMLGAVLGLAAFCYRTFGWIRLEEPMSEQRYRAFKNLKPKYKRTQEPNLSKLRIGWWKRRKAS